MYNKKVNEVLTHPFFRSESDISFANHVENYIFSVSYVYFSVEYLSLIHISEPTRQAEISYAVFCLKKKKKKKEKSNKKKKKKT